MLPVLTLIYFMVRGESDGGIEIDTIEYQQTEKIETELKDVDRIRIRKVYDCCPVSCSDF